MPRHQGAAYGASGVQLQGEEGNVNNEEHTGTSTQGAHRRTYSDATLPFSPSSHPSPFARYPPSINSGHPHGQDNLESQAPPPSSLQAPASNVPSQIGRQETDPRDTDIPASHEVDGRRKSASEVSSAEEYIGPARDAARRERQRKAAQASQQQNSRNTVQQISATAPNSSSAPQFPSIYPYNAHIYPPLSPSELPTLKTIKNREPPSSTLPSFPLSSPWLSVLAPIQSGELSLEQKQELWPDTYRPKRSRRAAPVDAAVPSSPLLPGKGPKRRPVVTLAPITGKRRRLITPAQEKRSSSEISTISTELSEDSSSASLDGRPRSQRERREYRGAALERRCLRMDRRKASYAAQTRQTPFLETDLPCLVSDYYSRRLATRQIRGYAAAVEGATYTNGSGRSGSTGTVK